MPIQICVWSVRFSRCKKKENFVLFKSPRLICRTYSWPEKPIPVACGVNFTKPEINLSYASAEIPQQWNSKTINCVIILRWQTTKGEIGVGKLWKSFGGSVQVVKNRKLSDQAQFDAWIATISQRLFGFENSWNICSSPCNARPIRIQHNYIGSWPINQRHSVGTATATATREEKWSWEWVLESNCTLGKNRSTNRSKKYLKNCVETILF